MKLNIYFGKIIKIILTFFLIQKYRKCFYPLYNAFRILGITPKHTFYVSTRN